MRQVPLLAWLVVVWVMLWGTWTAANLVTGLVVAVFVTTLLPLPPAVRGTALHPWGLARFAARFLRDLVVSSLQVAWLAVRPARVPPSAVIAVTLRSDSETVLMVTAEAQTLVPGSIVIAIDRPSRTLHCHVLNVRSEADVQRFRAGVLALEERVLNAIAPRSVLDQIGRLSEQRR